MLESNVKELSKPIVVPTTISNNIYKKVTPANNVETDYMFDDEIDDDVQKILEEQPKRRGRPRKTPISNDENTEEIKPKRRGRPRKNPIIEDNENEDDTKQLMYQNELNKDIDEEDLVEGILPGIEEESDAEDIDVLSNIQDDENQLYNNNLDEDDFIENNDTSENSDTYFDDNNDFEETDEDDTNEGFEEHETLDNQENKYMKTYDNVFDDEEFEGLLSKEKKVVTFVGASKNGTSFILNNLAEHLSSRGINVAILDATQNRNTYYIYTKKHYPSRIVFFVIE